MKQKQKKKYKKTRDIITKCTLCVHSRCHCSKWRSMTKLAYVAAWSIVLWLTSMQVFVFAHYLRNSIMFLLNWVPSIYKKRVHVVRYCWSSIWNQAIERWRRYRCALSTAKKTHTEPHSTYEKIKSRSLNEKKNDSVID